MYEKIINEKNELMDAYEKAEEAGDKQRMTEIYEEIKEINDFMATEFF
ncbi:hypothetical protein IMSAGC015_01263 [Lachnospiraceae bacterium]|nr:hypothetical protein IMSAGC015_01263 [Lachnospiraceae bacterium]